VKVDISTQQAQPSATALLNTAQGDGDDENEEVGFAFPDYGDEEDEE